MQHSAPQPNFNTSYVTVQLYVDADFLEKDIISIHPMLRFNCLSHWLLISANLISIHPMLRFNVIIFMGTLFINIISIHPMLRFNIIFILGKLCLAPISIHPMLRFNPVFNFHAVQFFHYFNTSYVTVQLYEGYGIPKEEKISIHPMLRFNKFHSHLVLSSSGISIHPMLRFNSS